MMGSDIRQVFIFALDAFSALTGRASHGAASPSSSFFF